MTKVFLGESFIMRLILVAMTKDQKYDFNNLFFKRPEGGRILEVKDISNLTLFTVSIQSSLVDKTPATINMSPVNMKSEELLRIAEIVAETFGERAKIILT